MFQHLDSIIAALVIFNVAVSATQKVLEVIKDKTESKADDKLYDFLHKYAGYVQKGIDWISANREHK
jgi:hypothetical protein